MEIEKKKLLEQKAENILNNNNKECIFIYKDGKKEKRRLFRCVFDGIGVFDKKSKKIGRKLSYYIDNLLDIQKIRKKEKLTKEKWIKEMNKIKEKLEKSKLWTDILQEVNLCLEIGFEKIQEAYKKYNEVFSIGLAPADAIKYRIEKIKEIDERLIRIDDKGKEYVTSIVWQYSDIPKIKKMYFGKYRNEEILRQIKEALNNKKELKIKERVYSFSYNLKLNQAWYSMKYNHFVVLDDTYALLINDY